MQPNWDDRAAYCLVCGAPLEVRPIHGRPRKGCTACDYVLFRSPAAAAAVVVARGREILLVRRAIEPYLGAWGLPAGFQDYGESPEDAARREVEEETGLSVELLRLLEMCYATDDPRKRVNVAIYLARPVAGVLAAADDASDARFFSLDALPDPIAFDSNARILARLRAEHPTGDIL